MYLTFENKSTHVLLQEIAGFDTSSSTASSNVSIPGQSLRSKSPPRMNGSDRHTVALLSTYTSNQNHGKITTSFVLYNKSALLREKNAHSWPQDSAKHLVDLWYSNHPRVKRRQIRIPLCQTYVTRSAKQSLTI